MLFGGKMQDGDKNTLKNNLLLALKAKIALSLPFMADTMKIGKDTVAELVYTLRYDNARGDIIEQVDEKEPMQALMGHDVMLEVLEKNLQGLQAGDSFEFIIGEGQGYGEYDEEKVVTVPQSELLAEVPQEEEVEIMEGDIIPIEDMDGAEYQAVVLKKEDGKVTLDFNHPLAGETLHFMGKVLSVRKATQEEIEAEVRGESSKTKE